MQTTKNTNWVYDEMMAYMQQRSPSHVSQTSLIDVLEIYCSADSQLTKQCIRQGLKTVRFGLAQGDLSTYDGRCKLYDILMKYRPLHVWMSPKCKAWCRWNPFNQMRSRELALKIQQARADDEVRLMLCEAVFRWQLLSGDNCHFHLEQPVGSDMLYQDSLQLILDNALLVRCDMCNAGHLHHPVNQLAIQKGTQIVTTSQILAQYLNNLRCNGQHEHSQISGSFSTSQGSFKMSQFTELYTQTFGTRVAKTILASKKVREIPVTAHLSLTADGSDQVEEPDLKRRRMNGKMSPLPAYRDHMPDPVQNHASRRKEILDRAMTIAPRVGKKILEDGDIFDSIQGLFPEYVIRVVELCKGTDRHRKPPIKMLPQEAPWRYTFGLHRHSLEPLEPEFWKHWESCSNRQMCSKAEPARLLITVFARKAVENLESPSGPLPAIQPDAGDAKHRQDDLETVDQGCVKKLKAHDHDVNPIPVPATDEEVTPPHGTVKSPTDCEVSKLHESTMCHGPKFKALNPQIRQWLNKIHHNLGHPGVNKLQQVLKQQGISTCHELQVPKIARPAVLSEPKDFNDVVGCDLISWTAKSGKVFQCIHFIDTATNFQLAVPVFRTDAETLFEAFQDCWLRWAGPSKQLVIENESALCSDQFAQLAQQQNIHLRVVAAYAHWQMGKTERHGDILQHILVKYDHEHAIETEVQFKHALNHACNAKNSLARAKGYAPEILVLGKSLNLPGNLSEDPKQPYLANSDSPEGLAFRKQLMQRESARRAFIEADNNDKLRRAFLRRQRPHRGFHSSGTYVMFWRPGSGESPGQWHGPARVIIQESESVLWLSFSSRVYRVAPGHVRCLSEREASSCLDQMASGPMPVPTSDQGIGVFQYEDLTEQVIAPPLMLPEHNNFPNYPNPPNPNTTPGTELEIQPDAEPSIAPPSNVLYRPGMHQPLPSMMLRTLTCRIKIPILMSTSRLKSLFQPQATMNCVRKTRGW